MSSRDGIAKEGLDGTEIVDGSDSCSFMPLAFLYWVRIYSPFCATAEAVSIPEDFFNRLLELEHGGVIMYPFPVTWSAAVRELAYH